MVKNKHVWRYVTKDDGSVDHSQIQISKNKITKANAKSSRIRFRSKARKLNSTMIQRYINRNLIWES